MQAFAQKCVLFSSFSLTRPPLSLHSPLPARLCLFFLPYPPTSASSFFVNFRRIESAAFFFARLVVARGVGGLPLRCPLSARGHSPSRLALFELARPLRPQCRCGVHYAGLNPPLTFFCQFICVYQKIFVILHRKSTLEGYVSLKRGGFLYILIAFIDALFDARNLATFKFRVKIKVSNRCLWV